MLPQGKQRRSVTPLTPTPLPRAGEGLYRGFNVVGVLPLSPQGERGLGSEGALRSLLDLPRVQAPPGTRACRVVGEVLHSAVIGDDGRPEEERDPVHLLAHLDLDSVVRGLRLLLVEGRGALV